MEDQIDAGHATALVHEAEQVGSIESSREIAAQRVFRGGALVVGGALLSVATAGISGVAVERAG